MARFETSAPEGHESGEQRLKDSKFIKKMRNLLAERIEELITDPEHFNSRRSEGFSAEIKALPDDLGEKIRSGQKVPKTKVAESILHGIGFDAHLSEDEIAKLKRTIFSETPEG